MEKTVDQQVEQMEAAIVYVLRYYFIFHYPLNAEEVHGNCSCRCTLQAVRQSLKALCVDGRIYSDRGYYSTGAEVAALVSRRLKANELAATKIRKAVLVGRIISIFPFVRFAGISGSLSKGYADHKSDFDFFIVTAPNRLWVCRTLLHVFKKCTFLLSQEHKFCMNYFLDSSRPELEEQNIYTAIELASLIPVSGAETYKRLQQANKGWIGQLLPNGYRRFHTPSHVPAGDNFIKRLFEFLLNPAGPALNGWLMRLTDKRWRKKWSKRNFPAADYDHAFKTTLYHSKNHPANYQKKILARLGS